MFKFFRAIKWYAESPIDSLTGPKKVRGAQVLHFSEYEMAAIRKGIQELPLAHGYSGQTYAVTRKELEAFVLTMRYTGQRIGDVTFLKEERLVEGGTKVFLYDSMMRRPKPSRNQQLFCRKAIKPDSKGSHPSTPFRRKTNFRLLTESQRGRGAPVNEGKAGN